MLRLSRTAFLVGKKIPQNDSAKMQHIGDIWLAFGPRHPSITKSPRTQLNLTSAVKIVFLSLQRRATSVIQGIKPHRKPSKEGHWVRGLHMTVAMLPAVLWRVEAQRIQIWNPWSHIKLTRTGYISHTRFLGTTQELFSFFSCQTSHFPKKNAILREQGRVGYERPCLSHSRRENICDQAKWTSLGH